MPPTSPPRPAVARQSLQLGAAGGTRPGRAPLVALTRHDLPVGVLVPLEEVRTACLDRGAEPGERFVDAVLRPAGAKQALRRGRDGREDRLAANQGSRRRPSGARAPASDARIAATHRHSDRQQRTQVEDRRYDRRVFVGVSCRGELWGPDVFRAAEELGFDGLFTGEHLLAHRPTWDAITMTTALACATERVAIGPAAVIAPLRHPTLLAKERSRVST